MEKQKNKLNSEIFRREAMEDIFFNSYFSSVFI